MYHNLLIGHEMSYSVINPRKNFGQHWLEDQSVLDKIIYSACLDSSDSVLEIGPGKGALTKRLLDTNILSLQAIELDKRLVQILHANFSENPKFLLRQGDILDTPIVPFKGRLPNKVVANIPYNITGPILEILLGKLGQTVEHEFDNLILMMQKEVADRILSEPGDHAFSALSVRIQLLSKCKEICIVPPSCFTPPPKVFSKVISITPVSSSLRLSLQLESKIESLLKCTFSQRRKKLRNTLIKFTNIKILQNLANDIGVNLDKRPQELSIMNWIDLAKNIEIQCPESLI